MTHMPSNNALLSDASSLLRRACGAAKTRTLDDEPDRVLNEPLANLSVRSL